MAGGRTVTASGGGGAGTPGASILTGNGVPAAGLGSNGDSYVDTTPGGAGTVYSKAAGAWTATGGTVTGAAGAAGLPVLSGNGVPAAGLGSNGQTYIHTGTGDTYLKSAGAWASNGNIRGPTGAGAAIVYPTYAGMRSHAGPAANVVVNVTGAAADGDKGEGVFDWIVGARPTQDNMTIIYHDTVTTGYWRRRWDGRKADLAWAGLAVGAGTAALQTALDALAGLFVYVDKLYTGVNNLNVPANTRLRSRVVERGFVLAAAVTSNLITLASGSEIIGLTLDGNAANGGAPSFGAALVRCTTSGTTRPNIEGCLIRNTKTNGIYVRNIETGCRIYNNTFETIQSEAVFSQVTSNMSVKDNIIRSCQRDGIKIHGRDGVNTTYVAKNCFVCENHIDYTGVTIGATALAIELWGGVQNSKTLGNTILGPEAASTGFMLGVSMDATEYCTISHNIIDDRGLGKISYGLEGAHARHCIYDGNIVRGFDIIGFSLSQVAASMNTIVNNTIRDARGTPTGKFGLQLVGGGTNLRIHNNTFIDAGNRAIFLNSSGSESNITSNTFIIERQAVSMAGVFVSGTINNCVLANNNGYNQLGGIAVAEQSTVGYIRFDLAGAVNWTVTGNILDGFIKGALATFAVTGIAMDGSSGGNVLMGNQIKNYNGVAIKSSASTGASHTIVYNKVTNSTAPAVRTTGTIDTYVAG